MACSKDVVAENVHYAMVFRWDTSLSGGPIVEQATHFVDLMRFFGGEIVEDTVKAVAVGPEQPLSDMPKAPEAEHEVRNRISRHIYAELLLVVELNDKIVKAVAVGPEQPLVDMPRAPEAEHEVGNRVSHQPYSGSSVGIQIAKSRRQLL